MSTPTKFLAAFLSGLRTQYLSPNSTASLSLVLGNESCDLDTFCSSLLYSLFSPAHPLPLIPIPRPDLALRPDILHLLSKLSLTPSDLLYTSDKLPIPASLHLVDHNHLTLNLPGEVRGVIDHHDDELHYSTADPRVIEKSGSCSSLVMRTYLSTAEKLPAEERAIVARLALAAVLMDTANMTQRVQEVDVGVVEILEKWLEGMNGWKRVEFYEGLQKAKKDVGGMELRDLLRKDYKEWAEGEGRKVGVSSVVKSLAWLKEREEDGEFLEGVKKWGKERGVDVAVVMTSDGDGDEFKRELLVWALTEAGRDCLRWFEKKAHEAGMQLKSWGNGEMDHGNGWRRAWHQKNVAMSRKQVGPLLRESLRAGKFEVSSKV